MVETKVKIIMTLGFVMIITGFLLWSEFSFLLIGLGIVSIGISLMIFLNKNN